MKIKDIYPLSPLQEGIFFHWHVSQSDYFEQSSYEVHGKVEVQILNQAFDFIVARHDALRTSFNNTTVNEILQVVVESVAADFNYLDESDNKNFSLENFKKSDKEKGFDLYKGSQIRLTVIKLADNVFEFIWSHHHIILDGWSIGILIKEFFYVYSCLLEDKPIELSPQPGYSAYSNWLMKLDKNSMEAYWEEYLSGFETQTGIPHFNPEHQNNAETDGEIFHSISGKNKAVITALCQKLGITENIFIQTVWGILLAKYNDTDDVVFGSVVSGRPSEVDRIEEMLGLFINTIPVRIQFDSKKAIKDILIENQKAAIKSIPNHYMQLAEIQSKSSLAHQLFDTIVVFENYLRQENIANELDNSSQNALKVIAIKTYEKSNYDFSLAVVPGTETTIRFTYNAQKYSHEFIENLKNHFENIYNAILENPDGVLSEIDLLSEEEKDKLLFAFNTDTFEIPASKNILSVLAKQISKNPNKIAVKYNEEALSYQELDIKSNKLANYLITNYHIKTNDFIGVELERSEMLIVTILSIFKLGAVYVPIDTNLPDERKNIIIENSQCVVVLNDDSIKTFEESNHQNDDAINVVVEPSQIAYVIYTSGSTGKPKGVMVTHQNLSIFLKNCKHSFGTDPDIHFAVLASNSFDIFLFEIFYPLVIGGTTTILSSETIKDLSLLSAKIEKINAFHAVPILMRQLLDYMVDFDIEDYFLHIKKVFMGGDIISKGTLEDISRIFPNASIHVLYGPTEGTVFVTAQNYLHKQKHYNPLLIGKPNTGSNIYITDSGNNLVPIGIPGEINIAGEQVANGYLNYEDAKNAFRPDFFSNDKLYKTGDLARWHFNGVIEFIGRKDNQIKLNGYRIELGEIENTLSQHQKIKSAIVLVDTTNEDQKRILAFYTGDEKIEEKELKAYLGEKLPSYMIPSKIIEVEEFPILINGKINTKALISLAHETAKSTKSTLPGNELEAKILNIWKTILSNENIGIQDNFFEIGGNSITLMKMVSLINKELKINLKVLNAYKFTNVETLTNHIKQDIEQSLEKIDKKISKSVDVAHQTMSILKKKQHIN